MRTNKKIFWLITVLFVPILIIYHFLTKKTRASAAIILLPVLFFASGCATVMTGTTQKVPVTSTPSGAVAKADGVLAGVTPCTFTLERKSDHTIEISKEGYRAASVILRHTVSGATAGNALIGGLIGLGIDATTGAMYKLVPERVDVVLEPAETSVSAAQPEEPLSAKSTLGPEEPALTETTASAQLGGEQPNRQKEALSASAQAATVTVEVNAKEASPAYLDFIKQRVEGYFVEVGGVDAGEVWMNFTILPSGGVRDLKIIDEKTTASDTDKDASMLAINTLHPFTASTEDMPKESISVELGIVTEPQN